MTDAPGEGEAALRQRIIAAVQAELDRHASVVLAETERLRAEAARERTEMERGLAERIEALRATVDDLTADQRRLAESPLSDAHVDQIVAPHIERIGTALDHRVELTQAMIGEAETRSMRKLEQLRADLDGLVDAASRPLLDRVRDEQESLARRVEALSSELRTFDEQAARMVVFVNELGESIEERVAEQAKQIDEDVARRVAGLDERLEDAMALSLRQHVETTQRVNERTERIEERLSQRAFAFEDKLRQEAGQRIAEIDAHLGRVSAGLDETLGVLNERMARIEDRFEDFDARLDQARAEFRSLDASALEEIKSQVSSAMGEATLVRIDMDRLQKSTTEHVDQMLVRLVAIESELADTTMDVSTAVQLERLEELERAIAELDPAKYVLKNSSSESDQSSETE